MHVLGLIALQAQASSWAADIDLLYWGINIVSIVSSLGIFFAIIYLAVKYRRGAKVDRSKPPLYNHYVELAWTLIPLGLVMGIFVWSTSLYFPMIRVPSNAMEVHVVGKQWMWKLQQPNGRWEMNELHLPAGRPVVLTLTSEDVLHAFFVPAFRTKTDVVPGRYVQLWFKPTVPGKYRLFCAEYCGTLHSQMDGWVYVMEPSEYEQWLAGGHVADTVAAEGERLFRQHGCSGCHSRNSSVRAPLLEGIYGKPVPVQLQKPGTAIEKTPAQMVMADDRYVHDAIVLPEKEVAAGYKPIMPTFKDRLKEEDIFKLISYIRSRGTAREPDAPRTDNTNSMAAEDYKARVGFEPDNLPQITGKAGGNAPRAPQPAANQRNPRVTQ